MVVKNTNFIDIHIFKKRTKINNNNIKTNFRLWHIM